MPQSRRKAPGLASRIQLILDATGWSQVKLAEEAGATPGAVGNWLRRNSGMEPKYAFALQDRHRWNARWILEGVEPARLEVLSAEEEMVLQRIRELPAEKRRALALVLGLG